MVDRKKDMIKTGGENVASREVEEVLYRHRGVEEVAVFGLATRCGWRLWSPRSSRVTASPSPTTKSSAHCREHLAGFKTPKRVFFVDSLPKNPAGNCSSGTAGPVQPGAAMELNATSAHVAREPMRTHRLRPTAARKYGTAPRASALSLMPGCRVDRSATTSPP